MTKNVFFQNQKHDFKNFKKTLFQKKNEKNGADAGTSLISDDQIYVSV